MLRFWIVLLLFPTILCGQMIPDQKLGKFLNKWSGSKFEDPRKLPLHLSPGHMELQILGDNQKVWLATQGVHLWQGSKNKPILELTCDSTVVWFKKGKSETAMFYAEGNVHFRWADNYFKGSKLFFDLKKNRGIVIDASLRNKSKKTKEKDKKKILPLYLRAKELWIHSENKFTAKDASISTCQFGSPHYCFNAREIKVSKKNDDVFVRSRNNSLHALGLPLFYLPYVAGENIKHWPLKKFEYGHSSKWGHYLLTTWGGNFYERGDGDGLKKAIWLLDIDTREERGIAIGPHFEYEGTVKKSDFMGSIYSYHVYDQPLKYIGKGMSYGPIDEDDESTWDKQYRIYGVHRHKFPHQIILDMELSKISDRNFLTDFFEDEAREGKEQETYIYARKIWDNQGLTFFTNWRLNDFQSQIEYLPKGTYNLVYQPLFPETIDRLYWTSQLEVSYLRRKDDEDDKSAYNGEHIFRSDWHNTLSYNFSLGPVHFLPFIGGRLSYFEDGIEEQNLLRATGDMGIELALNFYRMYNWKSDIFEVDKVLHVFTPHFRYEWIYSNSIGPDELIPFDSVDSIDEMQKIQLIFTNRLRTIRNNQIVDFFLFETTFTYFPERSLSDQGIEKTRQGLDISNRWEKYDNLLFDLQWNITSKLWVRNRSEYNFQLREFEAVRNTIGWKYSDSVDIWFDNRYYRHEKNIGRANISYIYDEKWAFRFSVEYDFRDDDFREIKFVIRRVFHRFALDFKFDIDEVDSNTSVTVNFYPIDLMGNSFRRRD